MSEDSSEQAAFKSVDAYYAVARGLQVRKEYRRALFYLALALRQDDKHIPSYLLRSVCYMYLCETDKALEDVQTVLQYEKKNLHALLLLGQIYYLRGDFEEALQTFQQGLSLRPTIQDFQVGVHKCETAIHNTCEDCRIHLNADLDLTEFYLGAFPPRRPARTSKTLLFKGSQGGISDDDIPLWPSERPRELQRRLLKQSYADFTYLSKLYRDESKRMEELKLGNADFLPDINLVFKKSKENRKAAVSCGTYLDRHSDLFHKMDPGFRHTKSDL